MSSYVPTGFVQRLIGKYDLSRAVRTTKHLAPDGVVDPPRGLAVGVPGLVHPAEFRFHLVEQRPAGLGESVDV